MSRKKSSLSAKASTAVIWRSSRVLSSAACSTYKNKVQGETEQPTVDKDSLVCKETLTSLVSMFLRHAFLSFLLALEGAMAWTQRPALWASQWRHQDCAIVCEEFKK